MKLDIHKFAEKLRPLKNFFVKYNKTIYFVFIGIIAGYLMMRVATILLKQAPTIDISVDESVKDVNAIKHAKYDVYYDALNYCDKSDSQCINSQITRLLTINSYHDNTIELKEIPNSQEQFKTIGTELIALQATVSQLISSGSYSDTIAKINSTIRLENNMPNSKQAITNIYNAITANSSVPTEFYSNKNTNETIKQMNSLINDKIKPAQDAIASDIKLVPALRSAVLKEQKANLNTNDPQNSKYLANNPFLPILYIPSDTYDGNTYSGASLYNILTSKQPSKLTAAESDLYKTVKTIRNNAKALNEAIATYQNKSSEIASAAESWKQDVSSVIPTAKLLENKDLKTDTAQEKAILDKFTNLDKLLVTVVSPYTDNLKIIEQYDAKTSTYIKNNSDDPTAMKLLSPSLSDNTYYYSDSNPFVN